MKLMYFIETTRSIWLFLLLAKQLLNKKMLIAGKKIIVWDTFLWSGE